MCSNHDNLNDDLSDLFGGSDYLDADGKADVELNLKQQRKMHKEKCKDCSGTGRFHSWSGRYVGPCYKCKGKGVRYFRSSLEQREKARQRREQKKAETARNGHAELEQSNPAEYAWLKANSSYNSFAASLLQQVTKNGSLSEKQIAAVTKILEKNEQRAAAKIEREANAPTVNIQPLIEAFANATASGLKRPKMFLGAFKFSLAPTTGRNAGSIYVVEHETDTYLGKITDGKFIAARTCSSQQEADVVDLCSNPLDNAVAYGKQTGSCSCCGRELTDENSVAAGIGPICASRYFGG